MKFCDVPNPNKYTEGVLVRVICDKRIGVEIGDAFSDIGINPTAVSTIKQRLLDKGEVGFLLTKDFAKRDAVLMLQSIVHLSGGQLQVARTPSSPDYRKLQITHTNVLIILG